MVSNLVSFYDAVVARGGILSVVVIKVGPSAAQTV